MENNDSIDLAFERFEALLTEYQTFAESVRSETDTRLKIIDTMLMDILGWTKLDISTEEKAGSGFMDYGLSIDGYGKLILEAKRMPRDFDLHTRECGSAYKLSGPVFKNKDVQEGIKQAIEYAAYSGCELACVTNGQEWIVFRANRIGDGTKVLDGKAFVFPSLDCIKTSFRLFHDLLAKRRVSNFSFRGSFQDAEGRIIRHAGFQKRLRPTESAVLLAQPAIIPSLDRIMTSFFQRMTDEHDKDMIETCFVETKESKAAEQRLLRLTAELVGHIRALDTRSGVQLTDLLDRARVTSINQFILLVGTKGAGKSTFIHRFFDLKLPEQLQGVCIPITVNLSDSDGDESKILDWLRRTLLSKAEAALGENIPTWDEIIGHMFFGEYQRWAQSTMANLYTKDKEQFKIEFGKHIESIRRDQPLEYIRGLLKNFVKGRKQIPCLIFDNADHFSIAFQERVFQFARSLFEQEICVVIMPITDKTSWQLSHQGALQSFENEALLLPTPAPKQVLEKRIEFVLKKIDEEVPKESGSYFIGKGLQVSVSDLTKFVKGLEEVFLNSTNTAQWLGQLSNHNIREVLEISRDLVNSPHIGLDEAFKAYVVGSAVHIPDIKIIRALLKGRYDIHLVGSNKHVHNIYDLNGEIETSPLLGLRILQALRDGIIRHGDTKNRYMAKDELISYCQGMGIDRRVASLWLGALLKKALVLNYDPTYIDEEHATQIEISPSGELHWFWAAGNYNYIFAMAEVTTVFDEPGFGAIARAYNRQSAGVFYDTIASFSEYLLGEDNIHCVIPDHERYAGQKELTSKFMRMQGLSSSR